MIIVVDMPWERDLSVNHCRMGPQGNWHIKPHVEAWMERLGWEIKAELMTRSQYEMWLPGDSDVNVMVDFYWPDKRRRDTHNYFKVICDAVAAGLGIDDKDILIEARSWAVARENPGFRIEITDAREEG